MTKETNYRDVAIGDMRLEHFLQRFWTTGTIQTERGGYHPYFYSIEEHRAGSVVTAAEGTFYKPSSRATAAAVHDMIKGLPRADFVYAPSQQHIAECYIAAAMVVMGHYALKGPISPNGAKEIIEQGRELGGKRNKLDFESLVSTILDKRLARLVNAYHQTTSRTMQGDFALFGYTGGVSFYSIMPASFLRPKKLKPIIDIVGDEKTTFEEKAAALFDERHRSHLKEYEEKVKDRSVRALFSDLEMISFNLAEISGKIKNWPNFSKHEGMVNLIAKSKDKENEYLQLFYRYILAPILRISIND